MDGLSKVVGNDEVSFPVLGSCQPPQSAFGVKTADDLYEILIRYVDM